ncbi:MAG: helix-turn-helix domain-containing protein [Chloroflexi bacterium]|nr:helix-turn-helix domain-containing protein [Chloroflexota bacterium]
MTRLDRALAELADAIREEISLAAAAAAPAPRNLTVPEARAALGGVARSTIYDLVSRGELRKIKVNRRKTVIPADSVAAYLERRAD